MNQDNNTMPMGTPTPSADASATMPAVTPVEPMTPAMGGAMPEPMAPAEPAMTTPEPMQATPAPVMETPVMEAPMAGGMATPPAMGGAMPEPAGQDAAPAMGAPMAGMPQSSDGSAQ